MLISFADLTKAQNYEAGVEDPRMARDVNYIQPMEVNYPDQMQDAGAQNFREVRNPQYDVQPAAPTMDEVDQVQEAPRLQRQADPTVDIVDQEVAEMIPEAPVRRVRGNGADLSAEQVIIGSVDAKENVVENSEPSFGVIMTFN